MDKGEKGRKWGTPTPCGVTVRIADWNLFNVIICSLISRKVYLTKVAAKNLCLLLPTV